MALEIGLQRRYFRMLMESQFWSPAEMQAYQQTQLAQLLRHAKAQSPFYEQRLDVMFRPNGEIDWGRWGEIPILRRSDLLEHRDAMLAREIPAEHGELKDSTTSGSTGSPVTVRDTEFANLALQATNFRRQTWFDMDWSKPMVGWGGSDTTDAPWPDGADRGVWGPRWAPASRGRFFYINRNTRPDDVLDFASRKKASYLTGRPKTLQSLAIAALRIGLRLPMRGLLTFGTGIMPDERADCLAAFEAPMWGAYSSKEVGAIAFQCPHGEHLHLNSETTLLEIVDESGNPCAPGKMGRVVLTQLLNTAQPLIRYDQGDLAVLGGNCSCGRGLPTIERIVGRTTNLFRFPEGERVAPVVPDHYRELLGARFGQFAQIGPLHVEVRYVAEEGTTADEAAVVELVRQHIRSDLTVTFSKQTALERVEGGKYVEYVCELVD